MVQSWAATKAASSCLRPKEPEQPQRSLRTLNPKPYGLGLRVCGIGFRVQGFGFRVLGLGYTACRILEPKLSVITGDRVREKVQAEEGVRV